VRRRNAVREDVDLRGDYEDCDHEGEGVGTERVWEKVKGPREMGQLYCSWEFRQEWE